MATYHVLHLLEKVVGSGVNSEWFPIEKVSAYWGSNMPFGDLLGPLHSSGMFQGCHSHTTIRY